MHIAPIFSSATAAQEKVPVSSGLCPSSPPSALTQIHQPQADGHPTKAAETFHSGCSASCRYRRCLGGQDCPGEDWICWSCIFENLGTPRAGRGSPFPRPVPGRGLLGALRQSLPAVRERGLPRLLAHLLTVAWEQTEPRVRPGSPRQVLLAWRRREFCPSRGLLSSPPPSFFIRSPPAIQLPTARIQACLLAQGDLSEDTGCVSLRVSRQIQG